MKIDRINESELPLTTLISITCFFRFFFGVGLVVTPITPPRLRLIVLKWI